MKTFIDEYFCDPKNLAEESILTRCDGRVSPEVFFKLGSSSQENTFLLTKRIECPDGFSMSVQASYSAYCTPRITLRNKCLNIYTHFEVGYPSHEEELLMPYAENPSIPTDTVYPYVPKEVVDQIIAKHTYPAHPLEADKQ